MFPRVSPRDECPSENRQKSLGARERLYILIICASALLLSIYLAFLSGFRYGYLETLAPGTAGVVENTLPDSMHARPV